MGFSIFFKLGLEHIADWNGYDHILFIIVMCVMYRPNDWKKILLLVTAFTVGHSLTLALAALDLLNINQSFVEFLIPVTILLTAIWNVIPKKEDPEERFISWNYVVVLLFGLVHGLGFSNYFSMLVGKNNQFIMDLFGFNLGVELGQIMIVMVFMLISYIFLNIIKVKHASWIKFVSGAAFGIALILIKESDWITQLLE